MYELKRVGNIAPKPNSIKNFSASVFIWKPIVISSWNEESRCIGSISPTLNPIIFSAKSLFFSCVSIFVTFSIVIDLSIPYFEVDHSASTYSEVGFREDINSNDFYQYPIVGGNSFEVCVPYSNSDAVFKTLVKVQVKDKDEKTLAWTTLFTRGKYAYMVKRFALHHTSRPADYMDYNIFCLIKDENIERLDRGMALDKTLSKYKSKILPLKTETLYDISFLR